MFSSPAELCRTSQIWLSLGGFQEKGPDKEHMYVASSDLKPVIMFSPMYRLTTPKNIYFHDINNIYRIKVSKTTFNVIWKTKSLPEARNETIVCRLLQAVNKPQGVGGHH